MVFELHPHLATFILHRLLTGDQKRGSWPIEKLADSLDNSALGITGLGHVRHLDLGVHGDHSDARSTAPQMTRVGPGNDHRRLGALVHTSRLMHHLGRIPPVEAETNYYADIGAGQPARHT